LDPANRTACVLEIDGDKQPYPVVIKKFNFVQFSSLLTAIQAVAEGESGTIGEEEEVRERVERALQRARKRVRGIRKELSQAADPEVPRSQANLLLARLGEVPRGATSVTLAGFDGQDVRIDLDPTLPPQENARALYQEAGRRERARDRLPGLLREAEEVVGRLEGVREGLDRGLLTLAEARSLVPAVGRAPPGRRDEGRIPFRAYRSSGGLEIRVGRSAKDNDLLTFRHSHPDDVWMHARDRAGAHVVLRWTREERPPQRDLEEAAVLAALHSGARTSGTVPVDWTRRKYVRKPRKAPPGTVVLDRVQTLFVEPDPELPRRLDMGVGDRE